MASYLLVASPEQHNCFSPWQDQSSACPDYEYASAEGHFPDAFGVQQKVRMTAVISKADKQLLHGNLYFDTQCHAKLNCENSEIAAASLQSSFQKARAANKVSVTEMPDDDHTYELFSYIQHMIPPSVTISLIDTAGQGETIYFKQAKVATAPKQAPSFTAIEVSPGVYQVCKLNVTTQRGLCEPVEGTMKISDTKGFAELKHSYGHQANSELFGFLHKFYQQERAMACKQASECNAEEACTVTADCTKS
ncbi:hypothetical protein [Rheinheimera sp.]|uniref:hypothetical protein n=1 Tax=Rheinheimera sp. TaxID=1869214 RepID=UPI00307CC99B